MEAWPGNGGPLSQGHGSGPWQGFPRLLARDQDEFGSMQAQIFTVSPSFSALSITLIFIKPLFCARNR